MNTINNLAFFLDVDNTLLNNDLVKEQIKTSLIMELGETDAMDFWYHHDELRSYQMLVDFPAVTRKFCMEKDSESCEMKVGGVFNGINFAGALFPKALEVLEYLKTLGTVSIFSEGDMVYQKMKIEKSGIAGHAQEIFLFEHKLDHLSEVLKKFENHKLIFVDDRDDKLMGIKKLYPQVVTIAVCQGHYAGPKCIIEHTADKVVGSIGELLEFKKENF